MLKIHSRLLCRCALCLLTCIEQIECFLDLLFLLFRELCSLCSTSRRCTFAGGALLQRTHLSAAGRQEATVDEARRERGRLEQSADEGKRRGAEGEGRERGERCSVGGEANGVACSNGQLFLFFSFLTVSQKAMQEEGEQRRAASIYALDAQLCRCCCIVSILRLQFWMLRLRERIRLVRSPQGCLG